MARKPLLVGRASEISHLEIDLWPLGKISGRIEVREKDVAPPKEMLVKTVAAPALLKRPPMPPGALTCPVDKEGSWSCFLPAATFDLAVAVEGFTPHYRWSVEVPPAKTVSLGTFRLERGGSVAGWVAVEGGAIDPARAVARLSFLSACDSDPRAVLELDRIAVERPVSKDGFLQFTGLAPGNYSLEVRQPGLAPARVASIRVATKAETFLPEPLLLTRPIALELEITPPRDEQGEPWRARVIRRTEGDSRPAPIVFDSRADPEGRFTMADQSPGWFDVTVLDARGNRVHSEPKLYLDTSARHKIEVHRVAIEGRLRLGSEPLAAALWFGGRSGEKSVRMQADEKGRFAGLLPSQSFWAVDIEAAEPKLRTRTRVKVQPDRSGRATVSIDLPDTQLFGRIVDQDGKPAARAFLVIATQELDQNVQVDEAGAFDVRGLPEGPLALIAADNMTEGSRQSDRTLLNATQGCRIGPLELRLRPVRRLSGTVLSPLGPVVGALVVAMANSPAAGGGQAATGPKGTFSLELPANLDSVTAVIKAPGFGTQAFPLTVEGTPLSLTVSEAAGKIRIAPPGEATDLQRENLRVALFQNGLEIPLSLLREDVSTSATSGRESADLLLANLAPGQYVACIARKQVDSKGAVERAPKAAVACDSGQLTAGATLELTLRGKD